MKTEEIGKFLQEIQHLCIDARDGFSNKYGWQKSDARWAVFNKCSSVLITIGLGLVFLERHLTQRKWWEENSTLPFTDQTIRDTSQEFEMFLRIGLIQNLMYSVESSLRIFLRSLNPAACKNGNAEFQSIYRCLLKMIDLSNHLTILDLWRNIRNVMHNNGLFMPPNGQDIVVEHKSKRYEFKVDQPISFLNTALLMELTPDMLYLMIDVVNSEKIRNQASIRE